MGNKCEKGYTNIKTGDNTDVVLTTIEKLRKNGTSKPSKPSKKDRR